MSRVHSSKSTGSISSSSSTANESGDAINADPSGGHGNNKNSGGLLIKMKSRMDSINDLVLSPRTLETEQNTNLGRKVSGYLKYVTSGPTKVNSLCNVIIITNF